MITSCEKGTNECPVPFSNLLSNRHKFFDSTFYSAILSQLLLTDTKCYNKYLIINESEKPDSLSLNLKRRTTILIQQETVFQKDITSTIVLLWRIFKAFDLKYTNEVKVKNCTNENRTRNRRRYNRVLSTAPYKLSSRQAILKSYEIDTNKHV